ncbi:MAG: hypothetical protein WA997_07115 [Anaerolineales bacterium]
MQITRIYSYAGYECIKIENEVIALWVTHAVGPRIIGLEINGGGNLFAELPDTTADCPGVGVYKFRGGHRLWHAPEDPRRTYLPDDLPLDVGESTAGIKFTQPVEPQTGIEKSLTVVLPNQQAQVIVNHQLQNHGSQPVELAAWAITQFKPGGAAILPQIRTPADEYGLLPNRQIALWPYTQANSDHIAWGDQFIFIHANMIEGALKIGFPNPHGWIGYLREKVLFIKKAAFYPEREYYDFGSSSECYCNPAFLELETLGPRTKLDPGESLTHQETWMLYDQVDDEIAEKSIRNLMVRLGM